ncbi:MAG: ASKHA domain-containing protein, partial [Lachnospiraceae bacterium]|nr:ASKHA domain-containing protein [Lachnospiraceae bacterium]
NMAMKNYTITILRNGTEKVIQGTIGESLLTALSEHEIYISAACGGKGRCGKCGVVMYDGVTKAGESDRQFFSERQLEQGIRLACAAYPTGDCRIEILGSDEADFEVVTDYRGAGSEPEGTDAPQKAYEAGCHDIAIDIGTTTLAVSLVGRVNGETRHAHTVTSVNHQRAYGADVISRIQAACDGKLAELSHSIRRDLCADLIRLLEESEMDLSEVGQIAVSGNTTMEHLLMEFPCETLGVYPFDPVDISLIRTDFDTLFGEAMAEELGESPSLSVPVTLLPGISTYVGADIVAGLLSCGFDRTDSVNVLIDLGTNGEMAIGNREKILVTSTAAGPAFEGGNISCGMGSVHGAICGVEINGNDVRWETIGGTEPLGLCGTGVIETACELLKEELIDETGMLDEDYFDDGFPLAESAEGQQIVFTQKDVREIQLAKSAVRAGLETLLLHYGATYDDIGCVYLAGGFGYRMDLKKAAGIGLLPEELLERTVAVGNSSLEGCAEFLTDPEAEARIARIIDVSTEVQLGADKDFNNFYTEYMFFE